MAKFTTTIGDKTYEAEKISSAGGWMVLRYEDATPENYTEAVILADYDTAIEAIKTAIERGSWA